MKSGNLKGPHYHLQTVSVLFLFLLVLATPIGTGGKVLLLVSKSGVILGMGPHKDGGPC